MREKNVTLDRNNIEKIAEHDFDTLLDRNGFELLDRNDFEKITEHDFDAACAERLRRYGAASLETALGIAHEKARQYLQNSLPARLGAF